MALLSIQFSINWFSGLIMVFRALTTGIFFYILTPAPLPPPKKWMVYCLVEIFAWGCQLHGAKNMENQRKNGPKPRFKVSKVHPDPKKMVLIHFWGICGLLDELQQQYLVKTSICQKPSLRKKITQAKSQTTRCNFRMVCHFSTPPRVPSMCGKMPKNIIL